MRTPVVIPRWVLTLKYGLFVLLGAVVWWASAPSVDDVTPDWYTPTWGICLAAAASAAFVGSLRVQWEMPIERWAVSLLASLMFVYALAPISLVIAGNADRASFSVVALVISILPTARAVQLLRRTGGPHA